MASFTEEALRWPNRVRCQPVGTPTPFFLYVGCECDPNEGKRIYNDLIRQFPDHECQRNCDASGVNATQKLYLEKGLMEL